MRHETTFELDEQSLITPTLIQKYNSTNRVEKSVSKTDLDIAKAELALVLTMAHQSFLENQDTTSTMVRLIGRMHDLRQKYPLAIWDALAHTAREHPVAEYILQDPFTRWSCEKPRGYSGDAGLIDLIYLHESKNDIVSAASGLGREIYDTTINSEACVAVRERREILAKLVDETASRTGNAEVLSVACGHLRESEMVGALDQGTIKRWIALDQDETSIEVVKQTSETHPVISSLPGNVAGLVRRAYDVGTFDLVYAAGLYDYLSRAISIRLTQRLMELVEPGGELLFANFSNEIATDGYMESFMNWPLILRTEEDMWDIINASVDRNAVDAEVFFGENRYICYARLRKKAI